MTILALDTATRWTGIALHNGTQLLAETGWLGNNNQTIEATPTINNLLHQTNLAMSDLSAIAVAIGPGSYTGLRIGLSLAKGIALAQGIPLIPIGTHEIVAYGVGKLPYRAHQLIVVLQAGRHRICAQPFLWKNKKWATIQPPIFTTWTELLETENKQTTFAGEINTKEVAMIQQTNATLKVLPSAITARRAGWLAELGWAKKEKNQFANLETITPLYMRALE